MECITANWLYVGLLSCKSISVLSISCVCDIIERQQKVVEEDVEEGEDHEFIDEGDELVL